MHSTATVEMCIFISPNLFPRHLTKEKTLHASVKVYKAEEKGYDCISTTKLNNQLQK